MALYIIKKNLRLSRPPNWNFLRFTLPRYKILVSSFLESIIPRCIECRKWINLSLKDENIAAFESNWVSNIFHFQILVSFKDSIM